MGRHLESRPQVEGERLVRAGAGRGKKVEKQAGTGGDGGAAERGHGEGGRRLLSTSASSPGW